MTDPAAQKFYLKLFQKNFENKNRFVTLYKQNKTRLW